MIFQGVRTRDPLSHLCICHGQHHETKPWEGLRHGEVNIYLLRYKNYINLRNSYLALIANSLLRTATGLDGQADPCYRIIRRVFKHCPRDQASVNAMKQTCVIVILAYFT